MKTNAKKFRPLTDTELRNFKPAEKSYKMGDGGGLYIEVYPNGSKLWRMKYRFDGKEKRLAFGAWPIVGLKDARIARDEAKTLLAQGIDPLEHKQQEKVRAAEESKRQGTTFEMVAREWFEKKSTVWSERHQKSIRLRLENMLFPHIGNRLMVDLEVEDFLSVVRLAEARGAHETSHRLAQLCGQVSRYARLIGLIKHDNATGITEALTPVVKQHRAAITDPVEIGHLLQAIDGYSGGITTQYALRILPYVFTRSGELRGAMWSEIDFDKSLWVIPAERMKMRRPHVVPLARQVKTLFEEMKQYTGHLQLIFPSPFSNTRCLSDVGLLNGLRRMGYEKETMSIHGFRSMASTILNEQGYRPDVIEAQLAHAERSAVRAAYNRAEYLPERREMMQAWADFLDDLRTNAG